MGATGSQIKMKIMIKLSPQVADPHGLDLNRNPNLNQNRKLSF
jgi:hypothetical protein